MTNRLLTFAEALHALSWAEMAKVSAHVVDNVAGMPHADRDFVAEVLSTMAREIIDEHDKPRLAAVRSAMDNLIALVTERSRPVSSREIDEAVAACRAANGDRDDNQR